VAFCGILSHGPKRAKIDTEQLKTQVYSMVLAHRSEQEICNKLKISPRSFYRYRTAIKDRIISDNLAARHEEFIEDVALEQARIESDRRVYHEVMNNKEESAWTRIHAAKMDTDASLSLLNIKYDLVAYVYSLSKQPRILEQTHTMGNGRTTEQGVNGSTA
jgi:hypothetical protein